MAVLQRYKDQYSFWSVIEGIFETYLIASNASSSLATFSGEVQVNIIALSREHRRRQYLGYTTNRDDEASLQRTHILLRRL
jgi:hypothetical protein